MKKTCPSCLSEYDVYPSDWKRGRYRACSIKCRTAKPQALELRHDEFINYVDMQKSSEWLADHFGLHRVTINKYARDNNIDIHRPPKKPREYKKVIPKHSLLTMSWV